MWLLPLFISLIHLLYVTRPSEQLSHMPFLTFHNHHSVYLLFSLEQLQQISSPHIYFSSLPTQVLCLKPACVTILIEEFPLSIKIKSKMFNLTHNTLMSSDQLADGQPSLLWECWVSFIFSKADCPHLHSISSKMFCLYTIPFLLLGTHPPDH